MRVSHFVSCSRCLRPFRAMNWSDSGSDPIISTAITSGIAPPTKNTERHPNAGISQAAKNPPTAAPAVNPTEIVAISATRSRRGLYSPMSAVPFGMMQPRPNPAMNRTMIICCGDVTRPVMIVIPAK